MTMVLWDTMSDPVLAETLREAYLRDARGVLVVCDASVQGTVSSVRPWITAARRVAGTAALAVVLNKSDLGLATNAKEGALRAGLEARAPTYLASAKTGENVRDAFEDMALRIATRSLAPPDGPLDGASLGMVIDASVRPRSLQELALATQLPEGASLARGEALVDRGYLRITSMDLAPDGRPSPTFTATGKSFPQLAS